MNGGARLLALLAALLPGLQSTAVRSTQFATPFDRLIRLAAFIAGLVGQGVDTRTPGRRDARRTTRLAIRYAQHIRVPPRDGVRFRHR